MLVKGELRFLRLQCPPEWYSLYTISPALVGISGEAGVFAKGHRISADVRKDPTKPEGTASGTSIALLTSLAQMIIWSIEPGRGVIQHQSPNLEHS